MRRESHQDGYQQHGENTQLCRRPEYGQTQVAQHRSEIRQRSYTHKDDRRKEPSLDQHVVNEVHQPQLMRDVMERHLPNVLHHSVHVDHAVFVGLYHPHIASGEVGKQHAERDRYEQQRFILFFDTQIKQYERNGIHDQKLRFSNDVAERSHLI